MNYHRDLTYRFAGLALFFFTILPVSPSLAQSIVADLDNYFVAVDAQFAGDDITLFGAIDPGEGRDVIIVIRGPDERISIQRKSRSFGLWVNQARMIFEDVPSYYAVAASQELDAIVTEEFLATHQIGGQYLNFPQTNARTNSRAEQQLFRQALVNAKQQEKLYTIAPANIRFLGDSLFRTNIHLPAKVRPGSYLIHAYHIDDSDIVGAQTIVLEVSRTGLSAEIASLAHDRPIIYGMIAVLIAVFLGWAAGLVFRRS